ncbi:amino-acid N-acetyltransferase, partial [Pseudoalteromonas sp. S4491]
VTGESYKLTSELNATQVALKVRADKMLGFCKEAGILDVNGEAIAEVMPNEAEQLLVNYRNQPDSCVSAPEFLPAAIDACRLGVHRCQHV